MMSRKSYPTKFVLYFSMTLFNKQQIFIHDAVTMEECPYINSNAMLSACVKSREKKKKGGRNYISKYEVHF